MSAAPASSDAARHHLARRLNAALARDESATTPMVVVDLDAFDANAADLVRRARRQARPGRLEVAAHPGPHAAGARRPRFRGRARLLLARGPVAGARGRHRRRGDGLSHRRPRRAARPARRRRRPVPGHLDGRRPGTPRRSSRPAATVAGVRVAIDIDAGLRMGRSHVGPKRSPLHDTSEVVAFAQDVIARGFSLVGVMTYEGQVAGVPDDVPNQRARSLVVRKLKAASVAQLEERRAEIAQGLRERGRPGVLERRRLGQRRVHRGRPGRHRGRRRLRAAGPRPVRPLRELRAAAGGVLRPPRRTPARWRSRDGGRRRLRRQRSRPARTGCRSRGRPRTCT